MRRTWKALAMSILGSLSVTAVSQTPFNTPGEATPEDGAKIGGTPTIDFVRLSGDRPNVPLRFGGVVSGSERIELDGRVLKSGVDYQMDYGAGIIYLAIAVRPGQSLVASYRHDKSKVSSASGFAGAGSLRLELVPSALKMVVGFGMAERVGSDVINTNMFGWNNSFSFAGGSLTGLYLHGSRQQQQSRSAFEYVANGPKQELGESHFTLQNYAAKVGGGTIEGSYQDISKNFTGFGAVADSGVNPETIKQLEKEKGLTRVGLNMKEVDVGGLKLSNSFKTVGDDKGDISWRSMGLNYAGFGFNWGSQVVDQDFQRFKDLAEGDRGQLAKEAGMKRNWFGLSYAGGGMKVGYNFNDVTDPTSHAVTQRSLTLDSSMLKLNANWQGVDSGFSRISSLPDAERNRLAREVGTNRSSFDLSSGALKLGGDPLKASQSTIGNGNGEFTAQDLSAGGKNWNLQYSNREADKGFSSFGAMQDAERMEHVKAIANMYQAGGFGFNGNEVNKFMGGQGVGRSLTRLSFNPRKDLTIGFDQFDVSSTQGAAEVNTINVTGKTFGLAYRRQAMDDGFETLNSLMDFERARLGTIVGLDKTDLAANTAFGKGGKFAFSQMNADSPTGGADRTSLAIESGKLNLAVNQRNVDNGFDAVGRLVDPERDLLTSLRGYNERDIKASWQLLPNLKVDWLDFSASSDVFDQDRKQSRMGFSFAPSKGTEIGVNSYRAKNDDPTGLLFASSLDQFSLSRSLGKFGSLKYFRETQSFDGSQSTMPDSETERFTYETKLNAKTSYKTEQTRTAFDNGDQQNVSEHTLSTELSKRTGISVSNVKVDRNGTERDEQKSVYGFWFDLGNGLRVMYGMQRQETGGKGTENTTLNVNPGTVGNVAVNQMSYTENQVDATNTRAQGNVQLQTKKPFDFWFLSDLKLDASLDTLSDHSKWNKQNRQFSLGGRIGSNTFLYGYKGQIHTNGYHAIDRTIEFATDQSDKRQLVASLKYKMRTMPWDEEIMIRNFSIAWRPTKDIEITNQMLTNPTVDRPDQLLGSVVQASRMNKWKIDFKGKGDVRFGGQWDEIMDKNHPRSRTGGVNVTLFANSPSPLKLFYGVEQADTKDGRKTQNRYHLQFDQRPGPNQMFSIFVGNVNYDYRITDGKPGDNWTLRLDWQIRF